MASKRVGDIYKIIVNDDFYIGSTWDFHKRLILHKSNSKTSDYKLYKAIRDNNNKFDMVLLYNYECYTDTELRIEERRCYDELKPNLNNNRPYRTEEERIEYNKQNYIKNRETILEKQKHYRIENRETIREQSKQYRIENLETYKARDKKYYDENRETINERIRQQNKKNRYICGCGSSIPNQSCHIKRHEQSEKHKTYLFEM